MSIPNRPSKNIVNQRQQVPYSPVHSLAVELLSEIFLIARDSSTEKNRAKTVLVISGVCRFWRVCVRARSAMWKVVDIPVPDLFRLFGWVVGGL